MAGGFLAQVAIAGCAGAALVGFFMMSTETGPSAAAMVQDCPIKGNVSIDSGERIYHLSGQEDYADTVINPDHGERWFCSEAEARQAGWRRAGR